MPICCVISNYALHYSNYALLELCIWTGNTSPIGVQKPGSQYSPAIYTMDIAYKIDIPLYIFDRYITGI